MERGPRTQEPHLPFGHMAPSSELPQNSVVSAPLLPRGGPLSGFFFLFWPGLVATASRVGRNDARPGAERAGQLLSSKAPARKPRGRGATY